MAFALSLSNDQAIDVQTFYEEHLETTNQQNDLPHEKRSRADITDYNSQFQATLADTQGFNTLDVVFLRSTYPPCRRSLRDLESTLLAQLLMNRHHRGKFLLAKLVSSLSVCRTVATAGIEDVKRYWPSARHA